MLDEVRMFLRYAGGLREYLRFPLSLEESYRVVEEQYRRREQSFLLLLERSIFQNPRSPYLALLRRAGITRPDVAKLVQAVGLESTLERLYDAGVYVALDEFQGRKPIVRSGLELSVRPKDFDNPCLRKHFEGSTGGSRGVPRRLVIDLDLLAYDAACQYLFLEGFGLTNRLMALWRPLPPYVSGIKKPLLQAKIRKPMLRWFTQDRLEYSPRMLKYAAFTWYTILAGRLSGVSMPALEYVPLARANRVAHWLAMQREAGRPACLDTLVGCAVRVCQTAKESGLNIAGSFFRLGSEPYTPAKARVLQESGVHAACFYAMAETGPVGVPCAEPEAVDDVHLLGGKMALIQRNKLIRSGPAVVNAFHFTTLLPSTPKVMLSSVPRATTMERS